MKKTIKFLSSIAAASALVLSQFAVAHNNHLSADEKANGWQLLFDGKSMDHWRNFKKQDINSKWVVKDGELRLIEGGGGDLISKKTYESFDLKLEWKISHAGNSGIFIMATEKGKFVYSHAVEVQILDNENHYDNKVDSHLSGSLYDLIAAPKSSQKPAEQWNKVRILKQGDALKVWQNGIVTADVVIGSEKWNSYVQNSKFKTWKGFASSSVGHLGLQDHSDPVAFRNIKIKEL